MADAPHQSLYRRYRPQRFDEVRGQEHITRALKNAVREDKVGHAYLFSGPRGTGKTSTARILAKALNCTDLHDGEPCGTCSSCVQIQRGASVDVHELDAASNNGVDAIRELTSRAALGTTGRWKVYIVDEVHMLSAAASNALLKTLEEPPGHVVFVLATTDAHKVLATVKSRTQHFEFRLLGADVLGELLRDISADAGLGVPGEAIDIVVRKGRGSARDALSVLDQVAASGDVDDDGTFIDDLVEAMADRDVGRALAAVAAGCGAGRDARRLAEELLAQLRNGLLATMAPSLVALSDDATARAAEQGRRLGPAGVTRAMEAVGTALAEMRDALDPRVCLEVALVRVANPEAETSPGALLERIERIERRLLGHLTEPDVASARQAASAPPAPATADRPSAAAPAPAGDARRDPGDATTPAAEEGPRSRPAGAADARAALGAVRKRPPAEPRPPTGAPPPRPPAPPSRAPSAAAPTPEPVDSRPSSRAATEPAGDLPTRDELTKAWGDEVLGQLPPKAKVRFGTGRFVEVADGAAVFALPNAIHRDRCEEVRDAAEAVLFTHFGRRIPLRLVVDTAAPAPTADDERPPEPELLEIPSADELSDAPPGVDSVEDRLKQAFPGAEEVG